MSMCLCETSLQDIYPLLRPSVPEEQIPQFLWQHLLVDLDVVSKALDKSKEDTLVYLHLLVQHMVHTQEPPGSCHMSIDILFFPHFHIHTSTVSWTLS